MKERGIVMSAPMVKALLDGSKTQTRRVMNPQPDSRLQVCGPGQPHIPEAVTEFHAVGTDLKTGLMEYLARTAKHEPINAFRSGKHSVTSEIRCPYGVVGDRLWVRETFALHDHRDPPIVYYRADDQKDYESDGKWKPSIFMPRWASRITLELTGVRVERLQEISVDDCYAEGCKDWGRNHIKAAYANLWDSLHGKGAWELNPWVWVLNFQTNGTESQKRTDSTSSGLRANVGREISS